jgi:hypothetical protein
MPCRIQDPDRKGKVESGVGHAQRTPLKGLRFEGLQEAQAYLDRWEERWGDTRIHGTTKRQVAAMFAEEKPALLPLPLEPFRYCAGHRLARDLGECFEPAINVLVNQNRDTLRSRHFYSPCAFVDAADQDCSQRMC